MGKNTWANVNTHKHTCPDIWGHAHICAQQQVLGGYESILVPPWATAAHHLPLWLSPTLCPEEKDSEAASTVSESPCWHRWSVSSLAMCAYGARLNDRQQAGVISATGVTTWHPWLWDWQLWSRLIALLSQMIGLHPGGSFVRMHCGNDVN